MADPLFSSSRFLYVILPRNRPSDRSRLPAAITSASARSPHRGGTRGRSPPPAAGTRDPCRPRDHPRPSTWPVRLARSASIIVKEVPRELHGSAGCSHLSPVSVHLRHARYGRAGLALQAGDATDPPRRRPNLPRSTLHRLVAPLRISLESKSLGVPLKDPRRIGTRLAAS